MVASAGSYRLTGSSVHVKVAGTVSAGAPANQHFRLAAPGDLGTTEYFGFWLESGTLEAFYASGDSATSIGSVRFSAAAHQQWRIREAAGTIFWETSPDGFAWTPLASAPASVLTFSTDSVTLVLDAIAWGANGVAPGQARFTALNR
jgi:hypothetical protein